MPLHALLTGPEPASCVKLGLSAEAFVTCLNGQPLDAGRAAFQQSVRAALGSAAQGCSASAVSAKQLNDGCIRFSIQLHAPPAASERILQLADFIGQLPLLGDWSQRLGGSYAAIHVDEQRHSAGLFLLRRVPAALGAPEVAAALTAAGCQVRGIQPLMRADVGMPATGCFLVCMVQPPGRPSREVVLVRPASRSSPPPPPAVLHAWRPRFGDLPWQLGAGAHLVAAEHRLPLSLMCRVPLRAPAPPSCPTATPAADAAAPARPGPSQVLATAAPATAAAQPSSSVPAPATEQPAAAGGSSNPLPMVGVFAASSKRTRAARSPDGAVRQVGGVTARPASPPPLALPGAGGGARECTPPAPAGQLDLPATVGGARQRGSQRGEGSSVGGVGGSLLSGSRTGAARRRRAGGGLGGTSLLWLPRMLG